MNQRSDIDRVLQTWLADGPTAIPDRVVDVVAARIGVQRQRRMWPIPRRTNMPNQLKLIAALAAALVVAVVGYNVLPRSPGAERHVCVSVLDPACRKQCNRVVPAGVHLHPRGALGAQWRNDLVLRHV